ncbi:MAG: hypothetical protein KGI62_03715 [Xanthomonadaceae bacterium]|nr:hypothetical protein [Xanthomonadaceae bacterium]
MGQSSFEVLGDIAFFSISGEHDLVGGVHQITDAILRTKSRGVGKLLVDITRITGVEPPSVEMRFWLMGEWAKAGRGSVRMALVTRREFMSEDRFGIAFGMNQGFTSNLFETRERAQEWLSGREGDRHHPAEPAPGEALFEVDGEVARFRLAGEQVLESGVRQIADAIVRTREVGLDKLLIDITAITGVEPPGMDMRYWLMGEWAKAGRSSVRAAIVVRREFIDPDRIGVIAGMNAGFISNVFETEAQALDWLLGRRGRESSKPAPPS